MILVQYCKHWVIPFLILNKSWWEIELQWMRTYNMWMSWAHTLCKLLVHSGKSVDQLSFVLRIVEDIITFTVQWYFHIFLMGTEYEICDLYSHIIGISGDIPRAIFSKYLPLLKIVTIPLLRFLPVRICWNPFGSILFEHRIATPPSDYLSGHLYELLVRG